MPTGTRELTLAAESDGLDADQAAEAWAPPPGGVIQARFTPRGAELAQQWKRDVLDAATLEHSSEREDVTGRMGAAAADLVPADDGDRQLLAIIGGYVLPQPDPDAIFDDVVPGVQAVARIRATHQEVMRGLDRHTNRILDAYVESQLTRAAQANGTQASAIHAVRTGVFTSVKDDNGDLSPSLGTGNREQMLEHANAFNQFTGPAPSAEQAAAAPGMCLYRRVKAPNLQTLRAGATVDEILPFSASWSREFAENWSPGEGVIFEIAVPANYPMLFQARRPGAAVPPQGAQALNQAQGEVTMVQSKLTYLADPRRVVDGQGRENLMVRVSAAPLSTQVAERQHDAMTLLSDSERRDVASQQREDDPIEATARQLAIGEGLQPLRGRIGALEARAPRASTSQLLQIGERIGGFASKYKPDLGPAVSVMYSFAVLRAGDGPLLAMLIRRMFEPQYYAGCNVTAEKVVGLLTLLLGEIEKLLPAQALQLKPSGRGPTGGGAAAGPGASLPDALRSDMERSFGTDFSDVRVHQGAHVEALGALAYTQGAALHFAPGQYAPDSASGRELLGHELAHVVQQRSGRVAAPQGKDGDINVDAQLEAEADAAGARAARGDVAGLADGGASTARSVAPIQRKVTASGETDKKALALITKHTAQGALLESLTKNASFNLVLMAGVEPMDNMPGISGVTTAILFADDTPIARVRDSASAAQLSAATLRRVTRMEVEVFVFTHEAFFSSATIAEASDAGQAMTVIHELERHAFPFYALFERIQMGQFNEEVMGDSGPLKEIATDLSTGKEANAVAQHLDPGLASNTARTTLSVAQEVGGHKARELEFRLYLDTVARGVTMEALTLGYRKSGGADTAAWRDFAALVETLRTARHGSTVRDPQPGQRVMIIDGAYRALGGTVSEHEVPDEERTQPDDMLVDVESGALTQIPASWCFFLA